MQIIEMPQEFTDVSAINCLRRCHSCHRDSQLAIDFSKVRFVFPFGTLLLAEGLRQVFQERRRQGQHVQLLNSGAIDDNATAAIGYLKYFGFFKYIGIAKGLDIDNRPLGATYIPIKVIKRSSLSKGSVAHDWHDTIESACDHIAELISQRPEAIIMLSYCFREIIRNVFEHAKVDYCSLMAQFYPRNNLIEIAIFDSGIGIFDSLARTDTSVTVENFLQKAITPGVSSRSSPSAAGKWSNSGFGLYVLSELGKRYGCFALLSSTKFMSLQEDKTVVDQIKYQGTGIRLRISLKDAEYFPNILYNIIREGEDRTVEIFGFRKTASGMSRAGNSKNTAT